MSSPKTDAARRQLARQVRRWSVEEFHDQLAEQGIRRAFLVFENGEFTLSHPRLLAPLKAFLELSRDFAHHEGIFIGREEGIPTLLIASVHDTRRGLAQGGLRFLPYVNLAEVLTDALRLAHGMTRKSALAHLWWGGGKGVVPLTRGARFRRLPHRGQPGTFGAVPCLRPLCGQPRRGLLHRRGRWHQDLRHERPSEPESLHHLRRQ